MEVDRHTKKGSPALGEALRVWECDDTELHLLLGFLWHKLHFMKKERVRQEDDMAVRRFLCFERQVILKYFLMDGYA